MEEVTTPVAPTPAEPAPAPDAPAPVPADAPEPVDAALPVDPAEAQELSQTEAPDEEDPVLAALAALQERLAQISGSFESKIKYDSVKEKVIDELHREVQGYREDMTFKLMRPLFMDLIAMHDDMGSILRHAASDGSADPALINMVENLRSFQSTVEEILTRYGIEVYSEPGDEFVAGRQRASRMIATEDPAQHMKIVERSRKGFAHGGRVLRPEIVSVRRCAAAQTNS